MHPENEFTYEALPGRVVFGAGAARERLAGEVERLGGAGPGEAAPALFGLAAALGLPLALREVGMPADGADRVIEQIVESTPADNPRPVDAAAVRGILDAACEGKRPQ